MQQDFLVIGGGIAGLTAGAHLARLGSVALIEAETALGYHASGRSAALYESQYGLPATVVLSEASRQGHDTSDGGVLSPRGLMLIGGADQADKFNHNAADMGMAVIAASEAHEMVPILNPDTAVFAAYHADAWDIDTGRLQDHYAREIRASGGTIMTGQTAETITRSATGWTVTTQSGETFAARVLVNAAGAWADGLAVMAGVSPVGLTPLRRSIVRMPAPGGHDLRSWPMMLGAGETWYAKPDAGAWLVSPAEEDRVHAPHDAFADDMVLARGIARYQRFVTTEVTRILTSWAGLRTFSPDRHLVLGPAADDPDFIWVAGQGGYGFQTAPAAGQLVADLVAGRPPAIDAETVAALSPARFA